jgi:hypothetical protein
MEAKKADSIGMRIKFSRVNNDAGILVFYIKGVVKDSTWTPFEGEKKKKVWSAMPFIMLLMREAWR